MECLYPVTIQDKEGTGRTMQVPCGRCINCRVNKASEWTNRIMCEASSHKYVYFCTLTYAPEYLPNNGTLVKKHLQDFFKRLRKRVGKFRYYAVGEYGEYGRPHYHYIIFGVDFKNLSEGITSSWNFGFTRVDSFNLATARYVARYVTKKFTGDKAKFYQEKNIIPEFSLMSRRPGIGLDFFKKNIQNIKDNGYIRISGKKAPIPRYFYNKLEFSEEDFQKSEKLNTNNWKKKLLSHLQMSGYQVPNVEPENVNILKIISSKNVDIKKVYDFGKELAKARALRNEKRIELKKGKL